ncbi:lipocalin family protein [Costertonia aggregata]|uniref:Lipocalin family protein n=1 Tax=Costertonia aggregata TaxID=343403 RepID=A0A7H9AL69_9FLAO|nr:lipocalin family protein [Costertonia aggregata]QLG44094.1 lipocalin family protein [Costertonia aggregata]
MQKALVLLVIMWSCIACNEKVASADLQNLNGYWEIEEVTFPNGDTKDYKVNATIDYIKIDKNKGFRKKVQPKFDGTYKTSDDAAAFSITEKDAVFLIHYKNGLNEWSEQLVSVSKNDFSVRTEDGVMYKYKRFTPIQVTD